MKKISIGKKKYVFVDDDDFDLASIFKWHLSVCGAAQRRPYVKGRKQCVFLHRYLLGVISDELMVKHLNGNRLDCRRKNLAIVKIGEENVVTSHPRPN